MVDIDDHVIILGVDFFKQAKAGPILFVAVFAIMDGDKPCIVPAIKAMRGSEKVLNAIQLGGSKKGNKSSKWHEGRYFRGKVESILGDKIMSSLEGVNQQDF